MALSACAAEPSPVPNGAIVAHRPVNRAHSEGKSSSPATPPSELLEGAIVGLDQMHVDARFGEPVTEREYGLGKAMEYRYRDCSLEVTLYPEIDTRVYRALAYQVTSDDNTAQSNRACVERFADRVRKR
jgi:hypothetical protein